MFTYAPMKKHFINVYGDVSIIILKLHRASEENSKQICFQASNKIHKIKIQHTFIQVWPCNKDNGNYCDQKNKIFK